MDGNYITLDMVKSLIQKREPVYRLHKSPRKQNEWKLAKFFTPEYVQWQDGESDDFSDYGSIWAAQDRYK